MKKKKSAALISCLLILAMAAGCGSGSSAVSSSSASKNVDEERRGIAGSYRCRQYAVRIVGYGFIRIGCADADGSARKPYAEGGWYG